jgi:hypothetical protein
MKQQLTPEEKIFITENRLEISMNQMSKQLNKSYSVIREYMIKNNLQLNRDQVEYLRQKCYRETRGYDPLPRKADREPEPKKETGYKAPKWIPKPWDNGMNLITMSRA